MKYAVVFERAPSNWCTYVPDLPGCISTGGTFEDVKRLIAEAIAFHIEGFQRHGFPVPTPSTRVEEIEIAA